MAADETMMSFPLPPALSRYKRDQNADLFGEQVGSVAIKEILRVTPFDDAGFEVRTHEPTGRPQAGHD